MNNLYKIRKSLKKRLRNRERLFAGWMSFSHPSIAEIFSRVGFDFIAIDMEHSTITVEQSQRIISACQSGGTLCLPRPVSHSNDWIKPLLESGADGLIIQMVNNSDELRNLIDHTKYPPIGRRSYGLNRAQGYGFDFDDYVERWNETSSFIIQIETIEAVENIDDLVSFEEVDGVMIGPYDISGSLGVPGQLDHPKVKEASNAVIQASKKYGKACGTQHNSPNNNSIEEAFESGFTFVVLASDLFILWKWSEEISGIIENYR